MLFNRTTHQRTVVYFGNGSDAAIARSSKQEGSKSCHFPALSAVARVGARSGVVAFACALLLL